MHIQSKFARRLISFAARKALEKAGVKADIWLNDLCMTHSDEGGKVRVHLDMHAEMSEDDLCDILKKAGVL